MWHGAVDIRCIDFVAITASENWELYLALMPVTAMSGNFAVGDTSVGFGPASMLLLVKESEDPICGTFIEDQAMAAGSAAAGSTNERDPSGPR